jgi:hypothetical protein
MGKYLKPMDLKPPFHFLFFHIVGHMPILGRKSILGARLFLGEIFVLGKTYFWRERPNFGVRATGGKKAACKKRRKNNMQKEKRHGTQADKPTHDRVRVFYKDCNDYKPIK